MKYSQYLIALILALGATALLAVPASAYEQNQTCDRHNGPQPCEGDQRPAPIAWDHSCVLFYLDERGSQDFERDAEGKAGAELQAVVEDSFGAWNEAECSGLSLIYGGLVNLDDEQPGERRNTVTFTDDGWPATSSTTFASTVVNYHTRTGAIQDADIEVNNQFYTYSSRDTPRPGEADLQNTLTHEVGHFIGLAHTEVRQATMFGGAELGEIKKRTLHRDDINGICDQYTTDEYGSRCGEPDDDSLNHDGGRESFDWGEDEEQPASSCSVTGMGGSAILSPIMFILVFFAGTWFRRRR